jgi:DNA-3-methyladenine glycosylase I
MTCSTTTKKCERCGMKQPKRCGWVPDGDALYEAYHDEEWGVPVHDDVKWFEMLLLEGAQAGLSWRTVLGRREGYRLAFAQFDPAIVARFTPADEARLKEDPGIIRNRLKISSAVTNAQAFLAIQDEFGSFDTYIWPFVGGTPLDSKVTSGSEIEAETDLSKAISKDLKRHGFRFVGPTIIYALMQAAGLVNDHLTSCFRHQET